MWSLLGRVITISFVLVGLIGFHKADADDSLSDEHLRLGVLLALTPSDVPILEGKAVKGDGRAMALLGEAYALAFAGLPQSDLEAADWLDRAVKAGQVWAAPEASFLRYRATHATDIAAAAAALDRGRAALKGPSGGMIDPELENLAHQGLVDAQLLLAEQMQTGHGAPRDLAGSADWFSEAARRGSPEANEALGRDFAMGIGVPVDQGAALDHYRAAAESGDAGGELAMGAIYAQGALGVRTDLVQSLKWLALSARQGNKEAEQAFSSLAALVGKPAELEALQEAAAWQPRASADSGR